MAFVELERRQKGKVWVDDQDPNHKVLTASLGDLHFESVKGSGDFDTEYDFNAQAVNNAELNGFLVNQGSYHLALQSQAATGVQAEQGSVGIGFNEGAFWVALRIERIGYLHYPTRTLQPVGTVADYVTGPLTRTTSTMTFQGRATMNNGEVAEWRNLGTTPNGGEIFLRWGYRAEGLKEELVIDQLAREWIAANAPPSTPASETYFGYRVEVMWNPTNRTGVPRVTLDGVLQAVSGTHDFDDEFFSPRMEDAIGDFLGFMPFGNLFVPGRGGNAQLRKRFFSEGGRNWIYVGALVSDIAALLPGDLVFDPTITDKEVAANTDDCHQGTTIGEQFGYSGDQLFFGDYTAGYPNFDTCTRFTGVNIAASSTINTATIEIWKTDDGGSDFDMRIFGEDANNPATYNTSTRRAKDLTPTTAFSTWTLDVLEGNGQYLESPSIVSAIQEVVDDNAGTGDALSILQREQNVSGNNHYKFASFGHASGNYSLLNVDWTEAGAGIVPLLSPKTNTLLRM